MADGTEVKRGRGRPKGSEIDDTKTLQQVAELLISSGSELLPMTAMKRIMGSTNDATLRRVSRKWRERGAGFLVVERDRQRREKLWQTWEFVFEAIGVLGESFQRATTGRKTQTLANVLTKTLSDPKVVAWMKGVQRTLADPKVRTFAEVVEGNRTGSRFEPWKRSVLLSAPSQGGLEDKPVS